MTDLNSHVGFLHPRAVKLSGKLNWVRNPAGLMRGGDKIIILGGAGKVQNPIQCLFFGGCGMSTVWYGI